MKTVILFFVSMIVTTLFLVSCNHEISIDKSLIEQKPCGPPCWYNIELHTSTKDDVLKKLVELPFIDKDNIHQLDVSDQYGKNAIEISFDCKHKVEKDKCGRLLLINGNVEAISYHLGYEINIQELIKYYGKPDFIQYTYPMNEAGGCSLTAVWEQKNLQVNYGDRFRIEPCEQLDKNGKIKPDLLFSYVTLSEYITKGVNTNRHKIIRWNGFTDN